MAVLLVLVLLLAPVPSPSPEDGGVAHVETSPATRDAAEPPVAVVAAVAKSCGLAAMRKTVTDAIAAERKYSEIVGVVNLAKLEDYKQSLQRIDAETDALRDGMMPSIAELAKKGQRIPACSDPLVARLARCVPLFRERPALCIPGWEKSADVDCQAPELAPYIRAYCR